MVKVLVTDGTYNHSLAIVRCIGKKGFDVIVTSKGGAACIAGVSKYCKKYYIINDEFENYKKIITKENIDVVLPVGYDSVKFFSKNKKYFEKLTKVPVVNYEKFIVAGDKSLTYKFAEKIGIPTPKTYYPKKEEDLNKIEKFPVVIKASEECGSVMYAYNKKELVKKFKSVNLKFKHHKNPPIIQEFIPGINGYGFYALYWHGKLKAYYMHKRLHMFPRSGGPSAMGTTYYDKKLFLFGKRILDELKWHGVAMVEFKKDEQTGKYYLIEINPKYWGSLDLGIHAGYEIPYYHIELALGKKIDFRYKLNETIFMWPKNDLKYALSGKHKLIEMLKWSLNLLNPRIKKHWKITDIRPFIREVNYGLKKIIKGKKI